MEEKQEEKLVAVASFPLPYKAYLAKGRLEAEGIRAFLFDEFASYRGLGGWGLQVPVSQVVEARRILEEMPGLFVIDD